MNVNAIGDSRYAIPREPRNFLEPDDFMTLLIAELRNQDPLSPMDSQAMVAQLSQMQMVSEMRASRQSDEMTQALALMGRTVIWHDAATGLPYEGTVDGVVRQGSDPYLQVGERFVALNEVRYLQ